MAARPKAWVSVRSLAERLRVRIPPGAWMSVFCAWCVSSGRGLCDEPITYPEDSYGVWCASGLLHVLLAS